MQGARTEPQGIKWTEHLGLMISFALTVLLVFKILAVADWDPSTAKGIIATNGTANVLVGAALVALPMLYAFFIIAALPFIRARLEMSSRTNVERAAARYAESVPLILLLFLVPAYVVIGIFVILILSIAAKAATRWRASRTSVAAPLAEAHDVLPARAADGKSAAPTQTTDAAPAPSNRISGFEATSAALGAVLLTLWGSLGEPWLPTEVIKPANGELQVAYVLNQDDQQIIGLLDYPRRLQRWAVDGLDREYCLKTTAWWQRTVMQQVRYTPRYRVCPEPPAPHRE